MSSTSEALKTVESVAPGATDGPIFAALETAFGDTLGEVLQNYVKTCDALSEKLQDASAYAYWQEAARVALEMGHSSADLGFDPVAKLARAFADLVYQDVNAHQMRNAAQTLVFEYDRVRLALGARFPEHVASDHLSIA